MKSCAEDFWRMKRMMASVEADYNSESDPDYHPGDDVEIITRPRSASETQGDTSFTGSTAASSIHNRSGRSRRSSVGSMSTNNNVPVTKRPLPYWVKEMSKSEKYDPELEKFVQDDKYYREENDPDYELPATDDEIETEEEDIEDAEQVDLLNQEAKDNLPDDIKEGKYKEKTKVVSPVKVTLTPSKEGDQEPQEQIVTLESEGEGQDESDATKETEKHPQLWEKCLMMTEQPEDYDSEDDPEYVPPAIIIDTDLEYDELLDGEDYEISDNEMELLKADASKDATSLTPKCYMPIWVPVESPAERIQRAKEQFASVVNDKVEMADTSGKDTDSNGKKDGPLTQVLVEETGLTPSMKKLNVGVKTEEGGEGASPKPKRERKKSKSKGEEKSGDEKEEKKEVAVPKTPTKSNSEGEGKSPKKKSPEKSSKSPAKAAATEELSEK